MVVHLGVRSSVWEKYGWLRQISGECGPGFDINGGGWGMRNNINGGF